MRQLTALFRYKNENKIDFVTINGNISETARCSYQNGEKNENVTGHLLSTKVNMSYSSYAIDQFSIWLKNTLPVAQKYNYHIIDLFHLEQHTGGWLSSVRTEFDIVEEVFSPYNCRILIDNMLGVDPKYRIKKNPIFYKMLINYLWPALLDFPINPPDHLLNLFNKLNEFKNWTMRELLVPISKNTNTYEFLKKMKNRILRFIKKCILRIS